MDLISKAIEKRIECQKKLLKSDFQEQMEMMYKTIYYTIKTGHKVYICIDDNFDSSLHGMINDIIGKVKLCYPITSGLHVFSESPVVICCDNREGNSMLQIVAQKGNLSDLVVIIASDGYSKKLYDIAKTSKEIGMCVFGLLNGRSSLLHSAIDQILSLEVEDISIFYEIAFIIMDIFLYLLKFPDETGVDSNYKKYDPTVFMLSNKNG